MSTTTATESQQPAASFLISFGTYESKLCGINAAIVSETSCTLKPAFADPSHLGCVKCVALSNKYLVSGSTDETLKIHDIRKRVEVGSLFQHQSAVNCATFYKNSFLLSGDATGMLCFWRVKDWEVLHELKAHKGPILGLSLHPTGKLGLTVGADRGFRMWNLITGKCAFTMKMDGVMEIVEWSPSGLQYLVGGPRVVRTYAAEKGELVNEIKFTERLITAAWLDETHIVCGGENNVLELYDVSTAGKPKLSKTFTGHTNRIRSVKVYQHFAITASSDGTVRIWNTRLDPSEAEIGSIPAHARITCLAIQSPPTPTESTTKTATTTSSSSSSKTKRKLDDDAVQATTSTTSSSNPTPKRVMFQESSRAESTKVPTSKKQKSKQKPEQQKKVKVATATATATATVTKKKKHSKKSST